MKVQSHSQLHATVETGADKAGFIEVAPSALQTVNGGLGTVAGGPESIYTYRPTDPLHVDGPVMPGGPGGSCPGYRVGG